jgi:glycerol uptake facilitator protein
VLGWVPAVFQSHGYYFWVPIVGPLLGGVGGAWLYDLAIGKNLPPSKEPEPVIGSPM